MLRPREFPDDWYNVLVLHQNHVERPPYNYIREEFLDGFLDLVIWGHEHECKIQPRVSAQQYHVMQPGQTTAFLLPKPGEKLSKMEIFAYSWRVLFRMKTREKFYALSLIEILSTSEFSE
jgi:double-strand break repair protein MRE11